MIKQLTFTLLLTPMALLPTSRSASNLAENCQNHGASRSLPQITQQAISSSLTAQQEKNEDRKENNADDQMTVPESLRGYSAEIAYTSKEDAKILFEMANVLAQWGDGPAATKKMVQDRKQNRFFEAIDAGDLETISALVRENIYRITMQDLRKEYQAHLSSLAAQNLLSFWHKMLSTGPIEKVPFEHWRKMKGLSDNLSASHIHLEADYDGFAVTPLANSLTQDDPVPTQPFNNDNIEISLAEANDLNYGLHNLFNNQQPLSVASMAGRIEIVETMLSAMLAAIDTAPALDTDKILRGGIDILNHTEGSLRALLDCSVIVQSSAKCKNAAQVLFKRFGITNIPQYRNYPLIARKLMRAFIFLAAREEQEWIQKEKDKLIEQSIAPRFALLFVKQSPLFYALKSILTHAMRRGTTEMLQIIAEEAANIPRDGNWFDLHRKNRFEQAVSGTVNGEKLGILLSINAHPGSIPYQLGMGMLSHVEKNPRLLERLKDYVRRCRTADTTIQANLREHIPAVLAPCIANYALPMMPHDTAEYIMNLRPDVARNRERLG